MLSENEPNLVDSIVIDRLAITQRKKMEIEWNKKWNAHMVSFLILHLTRVRTELLLEMKPTAKFIYQ